MCEVCDVYLGRDIFRDSVVSLSAVIWGVTQRAPHLVARVLRDAPNHGADGY